eukprot:9148846-Pyramimonas_sp.AAC.4
MKILQRAGAGAGSSWSKFSMRAVVSICSHEGTPKPPHTFCNKPYRPAPVPLVTTCKSPIDLCDGQFNIAWARRMSSAMRRILEGT